MSRAKVTRKWEVFAGRNKFYCDGRLITAPHSGVFFLTIFLITATSILFFVFDCSYLAVNVTIAIPITAGLLFIFTMSALLRTSLSDPGIIPRATPEEAAYVEKQIEVTNSANSPTFRPPPRTKEVLVKGQTVKLKYCFTCKIFRPPRASHCSLCDNCVDRFDHHCPWVGNCVGRRNYRFFYMFIVSLAFLAVFMFACAIAHLILISKEENYQFFEAVKESPPSIVVALMCFFSVWSILGLAGFHTYLTTSNQTTNEDIKGSFTSRRGQENPYSQGNICLNCFYILCGPLTPSLIDRRGVVTEDNKLDLPKSVNLAPLLPMNNYPLPLVNGPTHVTTDLQGHYRQTTETTGMYSPFKKHVHRPHQIMPSKNCANMKVIPLKTPLLPPLDYPRKYSNTEICKTSHSLPQLKEVYGDSSNSSRVFSNVLYPHPEILCTERPYTPEEKRYNSNFGHKTPVVKQRPRSSCIYESPNVKDEYCGRNNVYKSDRGVFIPLNIRVNQFPIPEFSKMYIQDNFE